MNYIYGYIQVPALSGVCAGENRVGATDFWLVIRGTELGDKETSTFYRNKCVFSLKHMLANKLMQ